MLFPSKGRSAAGLAGALVLVLTLPAFAAPITVSLVPAANTIELDGPNDPLALTIQISNPDQLAIKSWSFDVAYDPAVLQPITGIGTVPTQGFEVGPYISGVMGYWSPTFEHNGVAPDVARVAVLNFAATSGNGLTGMLGQIAFDAVGEGVNSAISITNPTIVLAAGSQATGVVYNPATVTVQMPEPGCLMLLLVGALGLRRRRG